ncbi:MAG: helix-turn-helix transcriptional regulator [Tetrasphaera sp.]
MGYRFRESPSPLVGLVWEAVAEDGGSYTEAANEFWGIGFDIDPRGRFTATLAGPSPEPRELITEAGGRSWGVEFPPAVFLRRIPKLDVLAKLRELPSDGRFFEIAGVRFPVTEYDEMEVLVEAMHRQGVLLYDAALGSALAGEFAGYSERHLRRRASAATGLGAKRIEQLQRARAAYRLLVAGATLADAAREAGYSDQAHMTRAFRDISGLTPARILAEEIDPFASRP